ncbi:MAG: hypothetical protein ABEI97_05260 [Candidatus Nanohaloarchaea archaeon]
MTEPDDQAGDRPLLVNRPQGVAAWPDTDTNGDVFLRVKLPLGLGTFPLFPNDNRDDDLRERFNGLVHGGQG